MILVLNTAQKKMQIIFFLPLEKITNAKSIGEDNFVLNFIKNGIIKHVMLKFPCPGTFYPSYNDLIIHDTSLNNILLMNIQL